MPRMRKVIRDRKQAAFISKAKLRWGNHFDYSKVEYINSTSDVEIICPVHGSFWQRPARHLKNKHGCRRCANLVSASHLEPSTTPEVFIAKARQVHGRKYDYSDAVCNRSSDKVWVTCKTHGPWETTVNNHLSGKGCPGCSGIKQSRAATAWLDELGVPYREVKLPGLNFRADGYDPVTNTIYEFHGRFWHGHPDIYAEDDVNPANNKRYGDLYEATKSRRKKARDIGYNYVEKWEDV